MNPMDPVRWISPGARRILDVGCNVGELLGWCRELFPAAALAGIDVNTAAIAIARRRLPGGDLRAGSAVELPFPDESFDCITCIEVLEHLPPRDWVAALASMRRVLRVGGQLILRVPHAGLFRWLDPNNARFRFPTAYRAFAGRSGRDAGYPNGAADVNWHHHFTEREVEAVLGDGWSIDMKRRGGLAVVPIMSIAAWPLYRAGRGTSSGARMLQTISSWDLAIDYGRWSYDLLVGARRC